MPSTTPLHEQHIALGARMVEFAGWDMPLHYGSQTEEHHAVRRDAGLFDVSHMGVVDIEGASSRSLLEQLLACDITGLDSPGQGRYGCMLRQDAGILDDLIVFFLGEDRFRLVVNASTRARDVEWIRARAAGGRGIDVVERADLAMLAVQGPNAREKAAAALGAAARERALGLGPFQGMDCDGCYVTRTGYTGEDGWEILVPAERAAEMWGVLVARGIRPAGLGARDTLRLEAGLNLYGADMDETTHPLESRLAWTIAWAQDFIGREALEQIRASGDSSKLVGVVLEGRGVMRAEQAVLVSGRQVGRVTSGTYSPTLERSIAFARVASDVHGRVEVEVRGKPLQARIVVPPFVRHGRVRV